MHRPLFLHAAQAVYVYEFANEEHQPMLELLFGRSETSLEALLSKLQQSDVSAPAEMQTPPATSDILSELDNRDGEALQLESAEETSEEWYTDKSDSLRRFTYGVEHFATYELSNLQYMTDYDGKTIVRRAYDDAMRLVQTETFPAPAEVTKLTRATVKTLRYQDSSLIPYESEFVDEKNAKRTVTTYDERSLPVSVARYHTQDEELLDETEKTAYDDKKRIMKKETVTWTYTKDSKNRVRAKTHSTCWEYSYESAGGEGKPDLRYYEDDTLRMQTVYASPTVYTETLFFDGGFSIEATYEDYQKTLEIIYVHGKEQRRRTFEE